MAATARTAPAPDGPVASSPVTGTNALWTWFQKIISFIASLTPNSVDAYDTGWVPVALDSGYTNGNPAIRRIGRTVIFQASTVSGSFPVGSSILITQVPAEYKPSRTFRDGCYLTGGRAGLVGIDNAGQISVFNQTGTACSSAQISLFWIVD